MTLAAWILAIASLAVVSGCAKAKAATVPEGPPLATPAPPPRIIAPPDEPIAAATPPPEVPPAVAPRAPARPAARRPAAAADEGRSPEPAPSNQPASSAPAATAEPPLRPPSAGDVAIERKVRDLLTRASRDLNQVDYRRLSAEGRSQYDQSKRFSERAEQALKERDFVFAETLGDKAATLAAELLNR